MNTMYKSLFSVIFIGSLVFSCHPTKIQERERMSFNEGWLFEKSDDSTGYKVEFDDSNWRRLNLPHDWAIEGPFKPEYNPRTGGLPVFGKAWYRKHFMVDESKKGSIITIEFEWQKNLRKA